MVRNFEGFGLRGIALLLLLGLTAGAQPPTPVWIDTDPSVAPGGHEVDDGIALLQAFASPELDVRGVSIVFGNADLTTAARIGKEIVGKFGPKSLSVFVGAAGAVDLGKETEASRALEHELQRGRLTILALGPVTNVATVLRNHPDLAARVDQVIAVAGRRPGQRFTSGRTQKVPFRDLNFELDPEAFRVLLASNVPITLAPWELSSQVWITSADLHRAAAKNPGMAWILRSADDWAELWSREFGTNGFNPFDALAVGFLLDRGDLVCDSFSGRIETGPDDTSAAQPPHTKPYLLMGPAANGKRSVNYCFGAKSRFKQDLINRLTRGPQR